MSLNVPFFRLLETKKIIQVLKLIKLKTYFYNG